MLNSPHLFSLLKGYGLVKALQGRDLLAALKTAIPEITSSAAA